MRQSKNHEPLLVHLSIWDRVMHRIPAPRNQRNHTHASHPVDCISHSSPALGLRGRTLPMSYIAGTTMRGARNFLVVFAIILVSPSFETSLAHAQGTTAITPTIGIGNLGTKVTADGQTVQITGGTRPGNGTNLFHSFDQLIVGPGDAAHFLNTTPSLRTENILSRVTGGNPSSIFGTIDTMSYPEANLFLMNPAGIVFGPSATLHVGGSVAFTTANYLRLAGADGSGSGIFHADTATTSLLTSASVSTFGFLSPNPAAIAVHGSRLIVQPGQSISLVGGNITVQSRTLENGTIQSARLSAPGGQIKIASAASAGEIVAETLNHASINGQSLGALGTVRVSQNSTIDTSGEGGGGIHIRGGRLVVDNSMVSATAGDITLDTDSILITNGTEIATSTKTVANAGNIFIKASENIEIRSGSIVGSRSGDNARGHSGNVLLSSRHGDMRFADDVSVSSQTNETSRGDAGTITINALHGDILLTNQAFVFNTARGTGTLRGIRLTANNLSLDASSQITGDNGTPLAGERIEINLNGHLTLTGESAIATGTFERPNKPNLIVDSADLIIGARDILIADKSLLYAGTTTSGAGGTIEMRASNQIVMTSGALISAESAGTGNAGSILITAGKGLHLTGKSSISTEALPASTGSGGNIQILAKALSIENDGIISASTAGTNPFSSGGSIAVSAADQVTLTNGASITAGSTGPADAGNIFLNAGQQLEVLDGSSITTQAAKASGGNIDIRAIDRIQFLNSTISTSVLGENGSGGNIFIDPKVVILEGSNVTAKAVGGAGGNITFVTPLFLKDSASVINASSERGPSGTVNIESPIANLIGAVGQLVSKASPPQVLLQNRCIALAGGEQSTFILAGRDTLPIEPGGWLRSPVSMEHWTGEDTEHASGLMVRRHRPNGLARMIRSMDTTQVLSLRGLTPPGFLVQAFAGDSPTGCRS